MGACFVIDFRGHTTNSKWCIEICFRRPFPSVHPFSNSHLGAFRYTFAGEALSSVHVSRSSVSVAGGSIQGTSEVGKIFRRLNLYRLNLHIRIWCPRALQICCYDIYAQAMVIAWTLAPRLNGSLTPKVRTFADLKQRFGPSGVKVDG